MDGLGAPHQPGCMHAARHLLYARVVEAVADDAQTDRREAAEEGAH